MSIQKRKNNQAEEANDILKAIHERFFSQALITGFFKTNVDGEPLAFSGCIYQEDIYKEYAWWGISGKLIDRIKRKEFVKVEVRKTFFLSKFSLKFSDAVPLQTQKHISSIFKQRGFSF